MSTLRKEDRIRLRRQLADLGYGQAETESRGPFAHRFHPVPEHVRAFDPDIALIVGERGTGKSALFRAVFDSGLLEALARHAPDPRLPSSSPERVTWLQAHPLHRDFPDALGLRRSLDDGDLERALILWFAYLVRALRAHLEEDPGADLAKIWTVPGAAPLEVIEAFKGARDAPLLALDRLDERLCEEDRWIFLGYDELDTLGGYDWRAMRQALLGLIGFWASYSRRWQRIRAKLFLRTDLFRRHSNVGGADLAKLAANRLELSWNDRNLLAMLVKRMANSSQELLAYCRGKVSFKLDPDLGQIPQFLDSQQARPLIERMIGQFMGPNAKKGRTFTWILDHLRDAHGHVAPRSLVRLFEQAAGKDQANQGLRSPKLLHPVALRQALEDVSNDHVKQAINNEWPWLEGIRGRVQKNLMPMNRAELRTALSTDWSGNWGQPQDVRPPVDTPEELIEYLRELGVIRERPRERVDVPDIYLYGLGLKRQGGVARRMKTSR